MGHVASYSGLSDLKLHMLQPLIWPQLLDPSREQQMLSRVQPAFAHLHLY